MPTPEYRVYNETRAHLLTPRVNLLDTRADPLMAVKVLIEGLAPNAATGLWLNPMKSIPAVPRLSPYDLVYLDGDGCVVGGVELVPDDEAPRVDNATASALLLPHHTFAASRAVPGDRFVLRRVDEVGAAAGSAAARPVAPTERDDRAFVIARPSLEGIRATAPPQDLAPLAWPAAAVSTALAAPGLKASLDSVVATAGEGPVDALVGEIQSRSLRRPLRFPLVMTLASLRVRVHISIATAPTTSPAVRVRPREKRVGQNRWRVPVRGVVQLGAKALAGFRGQVVQSAGFLSRQLVHWKAAYLRWADSFTFRPASRPATRFSSVQEASIFASRIASIRKPRFLR